MTVGMEELRSAQIDPGPSARDFAADLSTRLSCRDAALDARALADLLRFTFDPGEKQRALLNVLHKHLLRATLEHARRQTIFYSRPEYREWAATRPQDPPDLTCWPRLERRQILDRFDDFIARDVDFASTCHTSGTTGPSLTVYKSTQELAFLWAYFQHLMAPALAAAPSLPLILSFPNLYHGVPIRLPSFGKVFVGGVSDSGLIEDAARVLSRTYRIPGHDSRISILSGLTFQLKLFTSFLIEQGHDLRSFGIQSLNLVGDYVTAHTRRFFADSWGAIPVDRFTLTESVGGANRCLSCDHFHLDPHVIGEVLDPDTGLPVEEGVGQLALTQLHPFVRIQPLIRYLTGDLVRRVPSRCSNAMTFDALGKEVNCISWQPEGRTEWLLFSADLHEIIEGLPDLRLFEEFAGVGVVKDRSVGSPPLFTRTTSEPAARPFSIRLTFELRYAPHYYPDRVGELTEAIRRGLDRTPTSLGRRMREGTVAVEISFVGPDTLKDGLRFKV